MDDEQLFLASFLIFTLIKLDLVAVSVDLEVEVEVLSVLGHGLRIEEFFVITLSEEFIVAGRGKVLVEAELLLRSFSFPVVF